MRPVGQLHVVAASLPGPQAARSAQLKDDLLVLSGSARDYPKRIGAAARRGFVAATPTCTAPVRPGPFGAHAGPAYERCRSLGQIAVHGSRRPLLTEMACPCS
jgi:hypothetical protein